MRQIYLTQPAGQRCALAGHTDGRGGEGACQAVKSTMETSMVLLLCPEEKRGG